MGGNSLLALTCAKEMHQSMPSSDFNYLCDLLLHRTFGDLLDYLANPHREEQSIERFFSARPTESTLRSNLHPVWSIQRCERIFRHNENQSMTADSSIPDPSIVLQRELKFHWKAPMRKRIDASPLIVLLDPARHYVIIGSHAGLLHAYQIDSRQLILSFQTQDRIEGSAALSRDGRHVLIGKDLILQ